MKVGLRSKAATFSDSIGPKQ